MKSRGKNGKADTAWVEVNREKAGEPILTLAKGRVLCQEQITAGERKPEEKDEKK